MPKHPKEQFSEIQLLTVKQVSTITGMSVASIWAKSKDGTFPPPVKLSERCTRWRGRDIEDHTGRLYEQQNGQRSTCC